MTYTPEEPRQKAYSTAELREEAAAAIDGVDPVTPWRKAQDMLRYAAMLAERQERAVKRCHQFKAPTRRRNPTRRELLMEAVGEDIAAILRGEK